MLAFRVHRITRCELLIAALYRYWHSPKACAAKRSTIGKIVITALLYEDFCVDDVLCSLFEDCA